MLTFFKRLDPCLVGMEACGTSHHWARELSQLGHEVRLIPPMYVKPYVKRGKSDAIDAEVICAAITRPTMRFVEVKTVDQQAVLSLHQARNPIVGKGIWFAESISASGQNRANRPETRLLLTCVQII